MKSLKNGDYARVSFNFSNLKFAKMIVFATNIHKQLVTNKNYENFMAAINALQIKITEYENVLPLKTNNKEADEIRRNNAQKLLVNALTRVGDAVNYVADGDRLIVLESGFELQREKIPTRVNTEIVNLDIFGKEKSEGVVIVDFETVANVKSYELQGRFIEDTTFATYAIETRSHFEVANLKPLRRMAFRLRAIFAAGKMSDWSKEVFVNIA